MCLEIFYSVTLIRALTRPRRRPRRRPRGRHAAAALAAHAAASLAALALLLLLVLLLAPLLLLLPPPSDSYLHPPPLTLLARARQVCTECKTAQMLINQLQLDAADERRAHGASPRVEALLKEQAEEQQKLERHLEEFEYRPRRALNDRVDKAQALRRHNLREGGDYEVASKDLPALSCDDSGDELTDDEGDDPMDGGGDQVAADQGAATATAATATG